MKMMALLCLTKLPKIWQAIINHHHLLSTFVLCIQALPGHSFASTPTTWQRQRFWTTHSSGDCAFWRFETWPKYPGNWTWPMPTKTILWRSFFCDIRSVCRNPCEACSSEGVSIAMSHPFTKSRYDRFLVCGTKKDQIMYSSAVFPCPPIPTSRAAAPFSSSLYEDLDRRRSSSLLVCAVFPKE